jgi:transient receptor potential cation channel subfamily V protein 5
MFIRLIIFQSKINKKIWKGENALHMAIVAENVSLVSYLLQCGANVHQRCTGKFFCCDDQKPFRVDYLEAEHPSLPVNTNYKGYSYFGEYPLSFAAILNQRESIRLLIARGADPNLQDTNGNTALHMLVINNNIVY